MKLRKQKKIMGIRVLNRVILRKRKEQEEKVTAEFIERGFDKGDVRNHKWVLAVLVGDGIDMFTCNRTKDPAVFEFAPFKTNPEDMIPSFRAE